MKKTILFTTLFLIGLSACTSNAESDALPTETILIEPTNIVAGDTPTPPAYLPLSRDGRLTKASAFVDSADLLFVETDPVQINLILSGHLPTPCHELRVKIEAPDDKNDIHIEIYSVADAEVICAQVLRAFNETIALGSYPSGSYMVWINGDPIGNFDT